MQSAVVRIHRKGRAIMKRHYVDPLQALEVERMTAAAKYSAPCKYVENLPDHGILRCGKKGWNYEQG